MQIDRYRSDVTCLLWSTNVAAPFGPIAEYQRQKDDPRFRGIPLPIWPPHCHQTPQQKCQKSSPFRPENLHVGQIWGELTIVVICQFSNQSQGLDKRPLDSWNYWDTSRPTVGRFTIPDGGTQKLPSVLRLCCEQCTSVVVRRIRTIRSLESLPCFLWDINDILDSRYEFHVFVYNIRTHRGNFMWHNLMLM